MKLLLVLSLFSFNLFASELYKFKLDGARKTTIDFEKYKGKSILLVNIATKCGYTGQLDGLEKLYKKYSEKGFVVVGVPSNDFGGQTPENDKDVVKFCKLNYGVTFPLTTKVVVKGDNKIDLYKFLVKSTGDEEIGWNFTKFLFDKKGNLVKRFPSSVSPSDKNLVKLIESNL